MITREFEQTWIQNRNPINNMIEKNVIVDFYSYVTNLRDDLNAIKKYYNNQFNSISTKSIEYIIYTFNNLINKFNDICIDDEYRDRFYINTFRFKEVKKDLFLRDNNIYKIKDEYYLKLRDIADSIFKLEDYVASYSKILWNNTLTDINEYDKDKKYCLLVHVDYKCLDPKMISEEFNYYCVNQMGMCCSLITDEKTKLYENVSPYSYTYNKGLVGVVVKPKNNNIVAGANTDMLSTEFVNNNCEYSRHFNHSKVNKCYDNDKNSIYCYGTKIFTPKHAFDNGVDTINEVILDKDNIEVVAVFYTKTADNQKPSRLDKYVKMQEEKIGHKLNVIEVQPRNMLKQIDLENLY